MRFMKGLLLVPALIATIALCVSCHHSVTAGTPPKTTRAGHAVPVPIEDPDPKNNNKCWAPDTTNLYISDQEHAVWMPSAGATTPHFRVHFLDSQSSTTASCKPGWGTPFGPDNAKVYEFDVTAAGADSGVPVRAGCYKYEILIPGVDRSKKCNDPNVIVQ